jgi:molybdopterin-guanine dinucleotide biosynthesis protein B
MIPIISIVGESGAGKTHLMVKLVVELKSRGYRVATVKHSAHKIDLDIEGKDSWHHAQAGSDAVVISSPHKFALLRQVDHDSSLAELARFIGSDFDIILAEGFKKDREAKIEVYRKGEGRDIISDQDSLLAVVSDESLELNIPQFSPDDAAGLVDLIEKTYFSRKEIASISLFVNGRPVPLNDFVRNLFSNVLLGMVTSLKKIPQVTGIDIAIRKRNRE